MSPKGKIVETVPPARRRSEHDWDAMAILAKMNKGKSVLAARGVRNDLVKSVRKYRREPFFTAEGHVVVSLRDSHTNDSGIRVGDVYFTWVDNDQNTEQAKEN